MAQVHSRRQAMASGNGGPAGAGADPESCLPSWLLRRKVVAPELPPGYVRRAALLQRLDGFLERRLTVIQAPAGFGKTLVLAEIAGSARDEGRLAAWLACDDGDTPDAFGSYVALALEQAGLNLGLPAAPDAWWSLPAVHQVGLVARSVELHRAPCLLVLDDVARLPLPTFHLVGLLLRHAPRNLHLALAWRADPGLDLATQVLDSEAVVAGPEELRFSEAEMAQLLGDKLSPRELAAAGRRTDRWPVALAAWREAPAVTENYIRVRLLGNLPAVERSYLLDLAVFDLIEADMVEEVLGPGGGSLRLAGLPALEGLLTPVDDERDVRRMNPLLRDHCLDLLQLEDPARKRTMHERLARALLRRGRLAPAWRHAGATRDGALLSDFVDRYGACRMWLRAGASELAAAGRYLTADATASHPRLALLRCIALGLSGKQPEAETLLASVARATDGFARDGDGGDDEALAADGLIARALLAGAAGPPARARRSAPRATGRAAAGSPSISGARHAWLCLAHHERADFGASRRHAHMAQQHFTGELLHGAVLMDIYLGMSAMAEGRVAEAAASYSRARRRTREHFASDPYLNTSIEALLTEIDVERGRAVALARLPLKTVTELPVVWVDIHVAAYGVSAELACRRNGAEAVVKHLAAALDGARARDVAGLSANLAALLAYYLVEAGRPDDAADVWRKQVLLSDASELLDLRSRPWRTVETLACARLRLLAAQGEHAAAGDLADRLCDAAAERGLIRTRMRGLALAMAVADGAGQPERAASRLVEFLRLADEADYVRPLARQCEVSLRLLKRLVEADRDEQVRQAAELMLRRVELAATDFSSVFTRRELQVLQEAQQGLRNADLATRLGMTADGVRYHLKRIYRKAGVSSRTEAVEYARSLGILP